MQSFLMRKNNITLKWKNIETNTLSAQKKKFPLPENDFKTFDTARIRIL